MPITLPSSTTVFTSTPNNSATLEKTTASIQGLENVSEEMPRSSVGATSQLALDLIFAVVDRNKASEVGRYSWTHLSSRAVGVSSLLQFPRSDRVGR
jgi:hypothetical protein